MKFTVSKMKANINDECGYSFIDEFGCCIIVVYGEKEMKLMSEYLKN